MFMQYRSYHLLLTFQLIFFTRLNITESGALSSLIHLVRLNYKKVPLFTVYYVRTRKKFIETERTVTFVTLSERELGPGKDYGSGTTCSKLRLNRCILPVSANEVCLQVYFMNYHCTSKILSRLVLNIFVITSPIITQFCLVDSSSLLEASPQHFPVLKTGLEAL